MAFVPLEEQVIESRLISALSDRALFALGDDGSILSWNAGAEDIYGYSTDEAMGLRFADLYAPEQRSADLPRRHLTEAAEAGGITTLAWQVNRSGQRFYAEISLHVMREDGNDAGGGRFAVECRDISRITGSDGASRAGVESFRLLLESIHDYGIFLLDPEGRVASWNEGAQRLKGYKAEEIIGESFTRFYPEEAIKANFPQYELAMALQHGRFEDLGWRIRKDGSRFWANVIITPLRGQQGEHLGFAKVTRDLTERRAAEEQARRLSAEEAAREEAERRSEELTRLNSELEKALADMTAARDAADRATEAMREAYKDLDGFAYVASHDLKAPLRGIANLVEWIREDAGPNLKGESLEHMRLLQNRVQRMEDLINGILVYSRAGRKLETPELVDTGEVVRDVIEMLAPPSSIKIEVSGPMPELHAERVLLQQVFMNLLGNAIKYTSAMRPDAQITVSAQDKGDEFEFLVQDNGPGIDPRFHDRIWGIFQTLSARDKVEGTGIGLSVVKKIVESRGGSVSVESKPNHGATFRFTWPKVWRARRST